MEKPNTEKRERRFFEAMDKRHALAVFGLELEEDLRKNGIVSKDLAAYIDHSTIPEQAKIALHRIAEDYIATEKRLDVYEKQLEDFLGYSIAEYPYRAGEDMYHFETGGYAHGKVRLSRQPCLFILEYEDEQEFHKSTKLIGSYSYENGEYVECLVQGVYSTQTLYLHDPKETPYMMWGEEGDKDRELELEDMPLIRINGIEKADRGTDLERVLIHERQHANFEFFKDPSRPFEGIKDEVLARIRAMEDFSTILEGEVYFGTWYQLSEEQKRRAQDIIDTTTDLLDRAQDIFPHHDLRSGAMLAYHLIDLPLEQFPTRIRSILRYYEARFEPLAPLIPPDVQNDNDSYAMDVSDIKYGFSEYAEEHELIADAVVATFEEWEQLFFKALDQCLFSLDKKIDISRVAKAKDHALRAYQAYRRLPGK